MEKQNVTHLIKLYIPFLDKVDFLCILIGPYFIFAISQTVAWKKLMLKCSVQRLQLHRLDSLGLSHTGVQIDWRPYGNLWSLG